MTPIDEFAVDPERIEKLRRADVLSRNRPVWVPPELEDDWRYLVRTKKLTKVEAAKALKLMPETEKRK